MLRVARQIVPLVRILPKIVQLVGIARVRVVQVLILIGPQSPDTRMRESLLVEILVEKGVPPTVVIAFEQGSPAFPMRALRFGDSGAARRENKRSSASLSLLGMILNIWLQRLLHRSGSVHGGRRGE